MLEPSLTTMYESGCSSQSSLLLPHNTSNSSNSRHPMRNSSLSSPTPEYSSDPLPREVRSQFSAKETHYKRVWLTPNDARTPIWWAFNRNRFRGMKNNSERKSTLWKVIRRILDVLCFEIIVLALLECGVLYACREYSISFPIPQSGFLDRAQRIAHRSC